jgi:hypothetical protein
MASKAGELSIFNDYTLYLSKEGDSIEIKKFIAAEDQEFPLTALALACKTHEKVLTFLELLRDSEDQYSLDFWHLNNDAYADHKREGKKTHFCSLKNQIAFVKYKIAEKVILEDSKDSVEKDNNTARSYCVLQ